MAVVKIGKIKGTLARSITYVTNPGKTDGYRWASTTVGDDIADAESIARGFERALDATKGGSRRRGAVLALHVIQSFDPADPVTPRLAHLIGERFVREITGGTHDYVIAVMGKIHRRTLSEITFHDNMVTRRTDTAVTVRVPGTHGRLHLAIPCDRLVRDGRIWHAYLSDDVRQVLTDQDGGYARSTDCEGLYAWFARPALRLEDYCRQRFGGRDLTGVGGRALRQAISCDRLADSLRELKVLARAVDEGDGRLATLGRLADSVERNARHMRALIALIADSHDRGADATGLEAQLAIEERETRDLASDALALRRLIARIAPAAERPDGIRRTPGRDGGRRVRRRSR